MVEALTAIVEAVPPPVLVPTDHIAFRKEAVEVTGVEVVMVVGEVEAGVVVAIMGLMMEECTGDMTKPTIWKPIMSMILRLLTKIPITRMVHIQAIIRVMENMKVR